MRRLLCVEDSKGVIVKGRQDGALFGLARLEQWGLLSLSEQHPRWHSCAPSSGCSIDDRAAQLFSALQTDASLKQRMRTLACHATTLAF